MRLLVLQPALAHYRLPFFGRLGQRVEALTVLYGDSRLPGEPEGLPVTIDGVTTLAASHRRVGPMLWMPALFQQSARALHDVVVFSWNSRYLHLPLAMIRARRAGIGIALWGHGYSIRDDAGPRRTYRHLLARLADALIVYNHRAAADLERAGIPREHIAVARNTIDISRIEEAERSWVASPGGIEAVRKRLSLGAAPIALHVSRLGSAPRLRTLMETWAHVAAKVPDAKLVIVGDGPARDELTSEIGRRGLRDSVVCVGAVYGEDAIAPLFLMARVLLHPVKIGLGLNHAMAYGVPVVTFDGPTQHSPEFEALQHGANGLLAPWGDVEGLADLAARLLQHQELASRLGAGARRTMREEYRLERMVDGFLGGVHQALGAAQRRRFHRGSIWKAVRRGGRSRQVP
jgi:glycosyltransferase involved in cell wall biosynthesis